MNSPLHPVFLFPTVPEMATIFPRTSKTLTLHQNKAQTCSYACIGPGQQCAQRVKKLFANRENIILIIIGYAGGVIPSLQTGDIVISDYFFSNNQPSLQGHFSVIPLVEEFQKRDINIHHTPSFTANTVISSLKTKDCIRSLGAAIVDMENYWVSQIAQALEIPFFSLRVILDTYETQLPDLSASILPDGQISIWQTLIHLSKHPSHLGVLWQTFQQTHQVTPQFLLCYKTVNSISLFSS